MEVNAQEKYYLSRFRPLTGMVLSSRIYKRSPVQFSPPCGDCTKVHYRNRYCSVFAPLRGLYGIAKTLNLRNFGFAPLRGWYGISEFCRICLIVIAPLTGMVFPTHGIRVITFGFRPLTGIVLKATITTTSCVGFRPLAGIVHTLKTA